MDKKLEAAFSKIPLVSDDRALKEIDSKIASFRELMKTKTLELSRSGNYSFSGPAMDRNVAERDAQALLAGGDIEQLEGVHVENKRRDIRRQLNACEKAIARLENQKKEAFAEAIRNGCKKMPVEIKQVFSNMLSSGRAFCDAVELAIQADERLNSRGYDRSRRPASLSVQPYFIHLLRGGGTLAGGSGMPSMPFMLDAFEGEK